MRNSQGTTLLFLAVAVVLFFFSLALLPAVEFYCRFQRPALVLLILQVVMLALCAYVSRAAANRALVIGAFVFAALGLIFNVVLLAKAHGRC